MAYHRHQLAKAIREGRSDEEIEEMRFEIQWNAREDAYYDSVADDDE